jgi:hypothetical protein
MKKLLDKYEQGGMVLKKKTKDNYGKKPNVNDVKVSAGPGFEGDGYTAQNWKSPAWGGQFAMGGALPGAVGFTYARTQDPAPSNGKYAKKTLASAQDGKKFRLKTLDEMAAYNISNDNILSSKQLENKIIKDEQAKSEIAIKKNKDKQGYISKAEPKESLASRTLNILSHPQTALEYKLKGYDIPDHFERGETATGEGLANIVNPFFYVNEARLAKNDLGDYADQVKEKGFYYANPYTLGSGALHAANILPVIGEAAPFISKAAKYIPTSSRYISELEALGHVQTAGINKRAVQMMMGREPGASNVFGREAQAVGNEAQTLGTQARSQRLAAYEPPTDAELMAMNEAEANRYFRRPEQEVRRPGGISQQEIDSYINNLTTGGEEFNARRAGVISPDSQARSAAQAAANDLRTEASSNVNMDAILHRNNPMITERRLAGRQNSLRASGFTDAEIAADEAALRRGEPVRTPSQIRGGVSGTYNTNRSSVTPTKEWNPKEFRIGAGNEEGITKFNHPKNHTIKQDITISDKGEYNEQISRYYNISDNDGTGGITISTRQDAGDPYVDVGDISFFNRGKLNTKGKTSFDSSNEQMGIVFSHLPEKARIDPINTSMHSHPLTNTRFAKLNSGQPGRIEVIPESGMGVLNKITRKENPQPIDWYNEAIEQFPKIKKSNNTLSEYTGVNLREPFISYKGNPLPFEEFNTPQMKELFENPRTSQQAANDIQIRVNKYKTIKHWKNGGHFVDSMGQWAHPGDITTIPSNDITMRGVDYDVMGVSNTGDKKLMKPGKNYKFDGDYVTEYPRGGWLEKYK